MENVFIHVAVEQFLPVMEDLKQNKDFDYLSQITGVDYLEQDREPRFDVVYELFSLTKDRHIRVHVGLPEDEPTIPSVFHLWKGADFPERELFDMFGFTVTGHPNMKRVDHAGGLGRESSAQGLSVDGRRSRLFAQPGPQKRTLLKLKKT